MKLDLAAVLCPNGYRIFTILHLYAGKHSPYIFGIFEVDAGMAPRNLKPIIMSIGQRARTYNRSPQVEPYFVPVYPGIAQIGPVISSDYHTGGIADHIISEHIISGGRIGQSRVYPIVGRKIEVIYPAYVVDIVKFYPFFQGSSPHMVDHRTSAA